MKSFIVASLVVLSVTCNCYCGPFTLSDSALLMLDANWGDSIADVTATDIEGPGVVFDITTDIKPTVFWVSGRYEGEGLLVGLDISGYDSFALDFTLLSINGETTDRGRFLKVGAIIGGAQRPETLDLDDHIHNVSTTTSNGNSIIRVGFALYSLFPWDQNTNTISVLVKPADGAVAIPEPATVSLLAFGMVFSAIKRQKRWVKP